MAKNESARNKRDEYDKVNEDLGESNDKTDDKANSSNESTNDCDEKDTTPENSKENTSSTKNHEVMSSVLATMWMGTESGMIYVHSSVANWSQCIHSVKMEDCVVSIV